MSYHGTQMIEMRGVTISGDGEEEELERGPSPVIVVKRSVERRPPPAVSDYQFRDLEWRENFSFASQMNGVAYPRGYRQYRHKQPRKKRATSPPMDANTEDIRNSEHSQENVSGGNQSEQNKDTNNDSSGDHQPTEGSPLR